MRFAGAGGAGLVASCALMLAVATSPAAAAHKFTGPPHLAWRDCTGPGTKGFECATARVPLSYEHPHGATIHLAVIRHRASDPAHRIGTLFFNPGGPGGRGTTRPSRRVDVLPGPAAGPLRPRQLGPARDRREHGGEVLRNQEAEARFFGNLPWQSFPLGKEQSERWLRRYARLRPPLRAAERRAAAPRLDGRHRQGPRPAAAGARWRDAELPRGLLRDLPGRHLREPVPEAGAGDGRSTATSTRAQWVHRREQENGGEFLSTWLRQRSELGGAKDARRLPQSLRGRRHRRVSLRRRRCPGHPGEVRRAAGTASTPPCGPADRLRGSRERRPPRRCMPSSLHSTSRDGRPSQERCSRRGTPRSAPT